MPSQSAQIVIGYQVDINLIDHAGNKERLSLVIVPDDAADFPNGYLGEHTPMAKALLGERAGITIPYLRDDILGIEILAVTPANIQPPEDVAKKRLARRKQTMQEVEDTNAMVFASSFSGKWGDYDPDSIPKKKKPEDE